MARQYANRAESTLAAGVSAGATSISVAAGEGAEFPTTGDFTVLLEAAANPNTYELVTCSARTTDTLTISATANAWSAGDKVVQVVAKVDLDNFVQDADLAAYQALSAKGAANGYAGLGSDAKVADGQGRVQDLLDWQFARKTADETITATATLQDDDDLFFAVAANDVWAFDAFIIAQQNSGSQGISLTFAGPTGSSGNWTPAASWSTAGALQLPFSRSLGTAQDLYVDNFAYAYHIRGIVVNGATAGNLRFRWAQATSNANNLSVKATSYIIGRRVA